MIHQYKNSGLNIVMDIESGSVHVVDDIVYDIVHALDAMDSVSDFRKVSDGEVKASDFSELEGYLKFMLSKYIFFTFKFYTTIMSRNSMFHYRKTKPSSSCCF